MLVASSEFRDASVAQAQALGFPAATAFVPHPIQDRTDDELRALAEAAVDDVLRQVLDG